MILKLAKRMRDKRESFKSLMPGTTTIRMISYPTPECESWMRIRQGEVIVMDHRIESINLLVRYDECLSKL